MYLAVHNGAFELMHDLDLALWYAGQPVKKLHCVYGTYSDIGIQSPDVVEFLLDFEDRCTASVHLDFFQRPRRRQMELIGTEGVVTVEFARWDRCTVSLYEAAQRRVESRRIDDGPRRHVSRGRPRVSRSSGR